METMEERLTRNLQHGASKIRPGVGLRRTAQVMQLGVDPHKTGSIIGCRIFYVIFLIIVIYHNKSSLKKKTMVTIALHLNLCTNKMIILSF